LLLFAGPPEAEDAMPKPSALTPENVEKVAFLMEDGGRGEARATVKQIEEMLGVGASTISRLRSMAIQRGLLQSRCTLDSGRRAEVAQLLYAADLFPKLERCAGKYAGRMTTLEIIDSRVPTPGASEDDALDKFAAGAAAFLIKKVLPRVNNLGLSWGSTLERTVHWISQSVRPGTVERKVDFYPVTGEPAQVMKRAEESASLLAAHLDEVVNGASFHAYSLAGVSAAFPGAMLKGGNKAVESKKKVIVEYYRSVSSYGDIFDRGGLLDRSDCLLTGVGTTALLHDPQLAIDKSEARSRLIQRATVGNIAGLFLVRPGASESDRARVEALNALWTGLTLEHLSNCAERARQSGLPGVVVVSKGAKAETVAQIVREGLVNSLIIDRELAVQLAGALE
jgi:DNA-binding transcriptional regulator LsrR (DeoR family)